MTERRDAVRRETGVLVDGGVIRKMRGIRVLKNLHHVGLVSPNTELGIVARLATQDPWFWLFFHCRSRHPSAFKLPPVFGNRTVAVRARFVFLILHCFELCDSVSPSSTFFSIDDFLPFPLYDELGLGASVGHGYPTRLFCWYAGAEELDEAFQRRTRATRANKKRTMMTHKRGRGVQVGWSSYTYSTMRCGFSLST
eukprot:jgi/Mesvir1/17542/Mv26494-RA.1